MSTTRRSSLQWRLTLALLLVTGLVWLVVLVLTWYETEHELNELLDAHLAQTASVLAVQTDDDHDDDFTQAPVLHKYQPRVAFQIWHAQELMAHSAQAPLEPLAPWGQNGISDQRIQNKSWRVFSTVGRERDIWVVVAELQSVREDILKAGLRSAMVPVFLALPVLALLIWWTVYQALSPLRQLSHSVSQRHPQALHPMDVADVSVEVQPLVQALNRLFEKMAHQMESERRFTADAAHELRTPIAAIRMQAQVASGALQDAERQVALRAVLQGCDRATRLVAQLLQLARLEADSIPGEAGQCDAIVPTRETLAVLGVHALAKHQTLDLQAPAALPLPMPASLVGILVANLVDNAVRYSPEGATIHVQWDAVPVPRLVVQDSGPGMSDADLVRLGDRFFRVSGHVAEGSGLGWSIVRRLAQRYQLTVQVTRSVQWGGLQVSLSWPSSVTI